MWLYGEVLHSLPAPSRRILIDLPLKPPQDEDWLTYEISLTARLILFRTITCFSCTMLIPKALNKPKGFVCPFSFIIMLKLVLTIWIMSLVFENGSCFKTFLVSSQWFRFVAWNLFLKQSGLCLIIQHVPSVLISWQLLYNIINFHENQKQIYGSK